MELVNINGVIVAPHAGAWVETPLMRSVLRLQAVAPHAGAWVETCSMILETSASMSPPTRGRGLKHIYH